ncbi:MAG: ComEC/Rec2 family competence protein, partial [Bacteroidota bacterium]
LGIKDDLDKELKSAYSAAGAMHVLAVSGLHVGIIQLLLSWVLGFLKKRKKGKLAFVILSLLALWFYAFVTGLSPSVLRATTMFSIILIGQQAIRNHNIYNSLAVSAFLILLYSPMMIRDVGFQLSYIAVFGIVSLQPRISAILNPENYLLKKTWDITCVSLAAQMATLPISIYYFHQFPSYFLLSNLLVIPSAFIILMSGLFMLCSSLISDWLAQQTGWLLDQLIWALNQGILFIKKLPYNLLDWIWIDLTQVLLLYLIIGLTTRLLIKKNANLLRICYGFCFLFLLFSGYQLHQKKHENKLVFYEVKDNLAIDFISGGMVTTYIAIDSSDIAHVDQQIAPNRLANALPKLTSNQLMHHETIAGIGDLILWHGKRIIILSGPLNAYEAGSILETDVLVLSGNQYVDLEKLQKIFRWKKLIIDGTYQYYRAKSLSEIIHKQQIACSNLQTDGAVTITLKN